MGDAGRITLSCYYAAKAYVLLLLFAISLIVDVIMQPSPAERNPSSTMPVESVTTPLHYRAFVFCSVDSIAYFT